MVEESRQSEKEVQYSSPKKVQLAKKRYSSPKRCTVWPKEIQLTKKRVQFAEKRYISPKRGAVAQKGAIPCTSIAD